jgi:hypothetical protein
VGKVADVISRLGQILDPLSLNSDGEDGNKSCHQQREDGGMCAAKALHRFLFYAAGGQKVPRHQDCDKIQSYNLGNL